jgi:MFS family permease
MSSESSPVACRPDGPANPSGSGLPNTARGGASNNDLGAPPTASPSATEPPTTEPRKRPESPRTTPGSPRNAPGSLREAWEAIAGLSAVFLFEMLDNSILNVALPTIGRELHASTTALQLVTSSYAIVFGGLMLALSALADRVGRRRIMLIGLVLLALASLATAVVSTPEELIAVRAVMGVAAAMTTPGSLALAFRLFEDDTLRVRATTVISTVGLVGLAIGPTVGGLVLAVAPWQVLLLINVPIAALAFIGVRRGVAVDNPEGLHRDPVDIAGGVLGTVTIVAALLAPTLFVEAGSGSGAGSAQGSATASVSGSGSGLGLGIALWAPWLAVAVAVVAGALFVWRERTARHPLLDLRLVALPLVSSGLAFKAASGLATAGLGYLITLQLQLAWGWSPAQAALGMLPQVVVLLGGGVLIGPVVKRVGLANAAWMSATAVVAGLAVFATLGRFGYGWVLLALVLVASGMRVVGVVAGTNVMRGLPANRTTIGAALVDTASEVATAVGIAVAGTVLAALFTGSITSGGWSAAQGLEFANGVEVGGGVLTVLAGALVVVGIVRARRG